MNYFPENLPLEALGFFAHARACSVADPEQFARTVLEVRPQNVLAEDVFTWLHETTQPTAALFRFTFGPEENCAFCDAKTRAHCTHQIAYGAICELPVCANCGASGRCQIHKKSETNARPVSAGVLVSIRRELAEAVARLRKQRAEKAAPDAVNYYRATYGHMRPFYIRESDALEFTALIRKGNVAATSFKQVQNSELPGLKSVGTSEGIEIFMETTR